MPSQGYEQLHRGLPSLGRWATAQLQTALHCTTDRKNMCKPTIRFHMCMYIPYIIIFLDVSKPYCLILSFHEAHDSKRVGFFSSTLHVSSSVCHWFFLDSVSMKPYSWSVGPCAHASLKKHRFIHWFEEIIPAVSKDKALSAFLMLTSKFSPSAEESK